MSIKRSHILAISLLATIFFGAVLSSTVSADDHVAQDDVSVNVPVSCTMNGTGMNSHTAIIPNGSYRADIGNTTLRAFCNDNNGFAIYAIGFTNATTGYTDLVSAQGSIPTGTATSGDTSNWAMKLETDSTATYPIELDNGFGSYHAVPAANTMVAHRSSGTDAGSSATGSTLSTTYAAYISRTQKTGTYSGLVKYTLIHPNNADAPIERNQIRIRFNSDHYLFPNNTHLNEVVYGDKCTSIHETSYVIKSSNINDQKQQNGSYVSSDSFWRHIYAPNADQIRVSVEYSFSKGSVLRITDNDLNDQLIEAPYNGGVSDQQVFVFDSEEIDIVFGAFNGSLANYDFGYYITVEPIYNNSSFPGGFGECQRLVPVSGEYAEPVSDGEELSWRANVNNYSISLPGTFNDIISAAVNLYYPNFIGQTFDLDAVLPIYYTLEFDPGVGSGSMPPQQVRIGDNINLNTFTPPPGDEDCQNYHFKEWQSTTDDNGSSNPTKSVSYIYKFADGAIFSVNENHFEPYSTITLRAFWEGEGCKEIIK